LIRRAKETLGMDPEYSGPLEGGPGPALNLPPGRRRAHAPAVRADARRFLAMAVYRFGRRLRTVPPHPCVAPLSGVVPRSPEVALGVLTSISIDVDARIEPGFYVGHSSRCGSDRACASEECSVGQMCHHRRDRPDPATNAPVLGERVYRAPAQGIGPLRIADGRPPSAPLGGRLRRAGETRGPGIPAMSFSRRGAATFIYLAWGRRARPAAPTARGQVT